MVDITEVNSLDEMFDWIASGDLQFHRSDAKERKKFKISGRAWVATHKNAFAIILDPEAEVPFRMYEKGELTGAYKLIPVNQYG